MHDLIAWGVTHKVQLLTWISVFLAGLAAVLWGASAAVNLPVIGSGWGTLVGLDAFYAAMRRVARLNMFAAASAALSALLQAIAMAI
jgi:hypothetical protein